MSVFFLGLGRALGLSASVVRSLRAVFLSRQMRDDSLLRKNLESFFVDWWERKNVVMCSRRHVFELSHVSLSITEKEFMSCHCQRQKQTSSGTHSFCAKRAVAQTKLPFSNSDGPLTNHNPFSISWNPPRNCNRFYFLQ